MFGPTGIYQNFLDDGDRLVARVKLLRGVVGAVPRGDKRAEALLHAMLPELQDLPGEVGAAPGSRN